MSKFKIDLSATIIGFDNKPFADGKTYAEVLAQDMLQSPAKGYDTIKLYELAITMNGAKKVEVDTSDLELVKRFVTNDSQLFVLAKGPILKAIAAAKEVKD